MRIAMATLIAGDVYASVVAPGTRSKARYCQRHGFDFVVGGMEFCPPDRHTAWGKVKLVEAILPNYDWVFYVDADTMITNPRTAINTLIEKHASSETDFLIGRDATGWVNAGVFAMRNVSGSRDFLRVWWNCEQWAIKPWHDNSALIELLADNGNNISQRTHVFSGRELASYPREVLGTKWAQVPALLFQPGDFLVHVAGYFEYETVRMLLERYDPDGPGVTPPLAAVRDEDYQRFCFRKNYHEHA